MNLLEAVLLGLLQGITEFIPVSSSGHLVIAHHVLGVAENGLAFDVALHFGTLVALILLFWRDLTDYFLSIFKKNEKTKLAWFLVIATLPAAFIGYWLEDLADSTFRSPLLVSFNLLIFGIVMLAAEFIYRHRPKHQDLHSIKGWQALVIGAAQAGAIVPGVSRSGSTITAGMLSGLSRTAATRFSFLLAVPIITGAVVKVFSEGKVLEQVSSQELIFFAGIFSALISSIVAIRFMLGFVAKNGLQIFAYYRIALGLIIIIASQL